MAAFSVPGSKAVRAEIRAGKVSAVQAARKKCANAWAIVLLSNRGVEVRAYVGYGEAVPLGQVA